MLPADAAADRTVEESDRVAPYYFAGRILAGSRLTGVAAWGPRRNFTVPTVTKVEACTIGGNIVRRGCHLKVDIKLHPQATSSYEAQRFL